MIPIKNNRSHAMILQGGHVIDPANGIDRKMDVGIQDGQIVQIASHISPDHADIVVDVSGFYVTPGLLDIHTHVYTFNKTSDSAVESVNADAHLFSSGVTTTVDAGTAGWKNFQNFKEKNIDRSKVRILAFLNIAGDGMVDISAEQTVDELNPQAAADVVAAYPQLIVGIKSAHYWTSKPWDREHPPWASVERAVQAGELCSKPVMVDFWPRPPERSYPELILQKLRPGDIHTHVFAQQFPILDSNRRVNNFMFQARERGVLFDLGHGAASFWFRNAIPAYNNGFPPDTISTDLHMGNVNGPVVNMLYTMSKYLSIGMPLQEVVRRSTITPAQAIRRVELGTLSLGAEADVAVLKLSEGVFGYTDCGRARMMGNWKLECMMTLRAGQIVYDPTGLSMPVWENAPEPYWTMPEN